MEAYIVYPTKEQEEVILDFFKSSNISFEKKQEANLSNYVLEGIKKGQDDFKKGNTISFEDFKKNMSVFK